MIKFICNNSECITEKEIAPVISKDDNGYATTICPYCYCSIKAEIPPWSHKAPPGYLPLERCKEGYLYLISSRNASLGIYKESTKSFVISRFKFKANFLDEEIHWDADNQFGTACPWVEIEKTPSFINSEEKLQWLNNVMKSLMPV